MEEIGLSMGEFPLSKRLAIYKLSPVVTPCMENLAGVMDLWTGLMIIAFMAGIMGWTMTPFLNGILWFCEWRDGGEINWGMDAAFAIAGPFAWIFAIFEIILLYSK